MNKLKNLGYDRWLIYKQPRQESGLCSFSFASYLQKSVTQIYRALYGDAFPTSRGLSRRGKMKRQERDLCRLPTSCLMKPPTKLPVFKTGFVNARALSDCTLVIIEPTVDYGFHEIREFEGWLPFSQKNPKISVESQMEQQFSGKSVQKL